MVFTCQNSCLESGEECVIVQYEKDTIQNKDINLLKKKKKNKNRKKKQHIKYKKSGDKKESE